ncbi:MAG: peroxiredoxin family protein [Leptospirillia bacterium]
MGIVRRFAVMGLPTLMALAFLAALPVPAHAGTGEAAGERQSALAAMGVQAPKTRLPAPDFTLRTLEGGAVRLSDYTGKVVLLNFWATWCTPCAREMPDMEALWKGHRAAGFELLAINVERGRGKTARRFVKHHGLTLPVALDTDGEVRRLYEVGRLLPFSYLIGRDGRFIGKVVGERDWAGAEADALIRDLLAAPP